MKRFRFFAFVLLMMLLIGQDIGAKTWVAVESYGWDAAEKESESFESDLETFGDESKGVGYKDKKGNIVIPAQFILASEFNQFGIANVLVGKDTIKIEDVLKGQPAVWYKINKEGKILVQSHMMDSGPDVYMRGLTRFIENGNVGFIDKAAKVVIPAKFFAAEPFWYSAPVTVVCVGGRKEPVLDDKGHPSDCYFKTKGGKWGVIDQSGTIVIPIEYDGREFLKSSDNLVLRKGNMLFEVQTDNANHYRVIEIKN